MFRYAKSSLAPYPTDGYGFFVLHTICAQHYWVADEDKILAPPPKGTRPWCSAASAMQQSLASHLGHGHAEGEWRLRVRVRITTWLPSRRADDRCHGGRWLSDRG